MGNYSAVDVSRHIVNYINGKGKNISNLKLQKLLYFVQGFYWLLKSKNCFEDDMEAWDFGPVVRDVYLEFKEYGSNSIPPIREIITSGDGLLSISSEAYTDNVISEEDKLVIDKIVDIFIDISASSLVKITHDQAPWQKYYRTGEKKVIPKQEIRNFFQMRYSNGS